MHVVASRGWPSRRLADRPRMAVCRERSPPVRWPHARYWTYTVSCGAFNTNCGQRQSRVTTPTDCRDLSGYAPWYLTPRRARAGTGVALGRHPRSGLNRP